MRLFYVAATRAQDSLWLCGIVGEDGDGNRTLPRNRWTSLVLDWLAGEEGCDWQELGRPEVRYADEEGEGPNVSPGGPDHEGPERAEIRVEIGAEPGAEASGDVAEVPLVPV